MASTDLKAAYRTIMDDHFPPRMEVSFIDDAGRQTLCYEKASWLIDGVEKGRVVAAGRAHLSDEQHAGSHGHHRQRSDFLYHTVTLWILAGPA